MNLWFQKQLQHCRIYDDFEYHMEMYQDPFQMVIYSEPLLVYLFLKDLSSGKLPSEDLRKEASFHEDVGRFRRYFRCTFTHAILLFWSGSRQSRRRAKEGAPKILSSLDQSTWKDYNNLESDPFWNAFLGWVSGRHGLLFLFDGLDDFLKTK